jgi:hypothetical protein
MNILLFILCAIIGVVAIPMLAGLLLLALLEFAER